MDPHQIEKLSHPGIFPEHPDRVELIQTHLSVVCLAGERVYKFKKSIRLPFADFSTLDKRREACQQEWRLNQRLCPEIYLGVVPLLEKADGTGWQVIGEEGERPDGEVIDYAVRMVRLPAGRMLDVLLTDDKVSEEEIRRIAVRMVGFHREARRDHSVTDLGGPGNLRRFALENFEETRKLVGRLFPQPLHEALARQTARDFDRLGPLLEQRARGGLVVDGHGDLHARNICLTKPVAIYDCIEFSPAFRCGDVASDHAFLVMDLRFRGHAELADLYLQAVIEESGDDDLRQLMPLLVRYRAMVRAKVAAITAGEEEISEEKRAESAETAKRYLRFAATTAVEGEKPLWIALCGLPATGKSSLARALTEGSGGKWGHRASDVIRKELAGVPPHETLPSLAYTPEFSRRTYDELYRCGKEDAIARRVVVLDANFRKEAERNRLRATARREGIRVVLVECQAVDELIRARLRKRALDAGAVSDADLKVYEKLKHSYEKPSDQECGEVIRVESDREPEDLVAEILGRLISKS